MSLPTPEISCMRLYNWELPRRKTILIVVLLTVMAELVCLPIFFRGLLVATDYAPGFKEKDFQRVKPGDSYKTVILTLGIPLYYQVVSLKQDEAGRVLESSQDIKNVTAWKTNNSVVIYLEYSKPKSNKGNFQARQVIIQGGLVKQTRKYLYWD